MTEKKTREESLAWAASCPPIPEGGVLAGPPPRPLPDDIREALIAFARETWRNDGAEGEAVHKLCDELEACAAKRKDLAKCLMEAGDRWGEWMRRAEVAEAALGVARAALEVLAVPDPWSRNGADPDSPRIARAALAVLPPKPVAP